MPSSLLGERYELRDRIGSGGMAVVWRGFDRRLGREVAIKILSESLTSDERFRLRFEREARHIASLSHPNIVVVHDFGSDEDRLFIVMELVRGRALSQIIEERSRCSASFVTDMAADVLSGLAHAHEVGILHRDIKPGNILVTDEGTSKLADFGIAKATGESVALTDAGSLLGTVAYSSPEQISGRPLGPPSDLYSLGSVLYECLCGHPPFDADNVADLVAGQQFEAPRPLSELVPEAPSSLTTAVMRALEKNPDSRFATAVEMRGTLKAPADTTRKSTNEELVRPDRRLTATVTVLFCDLVGSTALQSALGDDSADEVRRGLLSSLRSSVRKHNGEVVKTLGDGLMAIFRHSAIDALKCATEIAEDPESTAQGLLMRVGLSHGEVIAEEGDFFGTPVVEASRLESAAEPGTVLVASVVRTIVGSRGAFVFDAIAPLELKGLPEPVHAFRVKSDSAIKTPRPSTAAATPTPPSSLRTKSRPGSWSKRHRVIAGLASMVVLASLLVVVLVNVSSKGGSSQLSALGGIEPDVGYTPRYQSISCPPSDAGAGITCGELIVPQDRSHPKGLQVHLLVVRAQAETANPAPDPIIDLGTSGGFFEPSTFEGTSSTTRLYSSYIELTRRGDAGSAPELACPQETTANETALVLPPTSPQAETEQVAGFAPCRAKLLASGINPNDYGNDEAVADVRDLMEVLHIEQANFMAESLGSYEIYDLMRQYPGLVRSVLVEDPVPPGADPDFSAVSNDLGAVDRYEKLCALNASCNASFPDLSQKLLSDYTYFQEHPVTVSTAAVTGLPPVPVLLDGDTLTEALTDGLQVQADLPLLASEMYSPNLSIAAVGVFGFEVAPLNSGLLATTYCKDVLPGASQTSQISEQVALSANPQFAGVDAEDGQFDLAMCKAWKVTPDQAGDFSPIVSTIPTLLYSGDLDPGGSPSYASDVAQGLSKSVVITFPTLTIGMEEQSAAPQCLQRLRLEFLRDPTQHLNVAACEAQSPSISFSGT